jgi:hypothetical protein
MSIVVERPKKRFPIGDPIRALRPHFEQLAATRKDLLILFAFSALGLIVTFAATLLAIWTGSLVNPALELARF